MAEDSRDDREIAQVIRDVTEITETQRTNRTKLICFTILAGLAIVGEVAVRLVQPWWEGILLAVLAMLIGPSSVIVAMMKVYARYVRKHHRRTARLEQQVDPKRTSSAGPRALLESDETPTEVADEES